MAEFVVSSNLSTEPAVVWRHAVSPAGVNSELRPLLQMTFPPGVSDLTADWKRGERLFRSWLLVAGVLPIEYDDLTFDEVEPGRRFLEHSSLFTQRIWEHERIIEPTASGCRIRDRVRFESRLAWLEPIYGRVFETLFRWRHRNLRRRFGESSACSRDLPT